MVAISFAKPVYLWLMGILPVLVFVHFFSLKYGTKKALKFANFEAIQRVTGEETVTKNVLLLFMRMLVVLFLILATAGTALTYMAQTNEYDIVLAIDTSSSMLAEDYLPNRLEAAKTAAEIFVLNTNAVLHMGIVTFSGASFILQTVTDEKAGIINALRAMEIAKLGGTDIGQALITSANLLASNRAKAIILITDGQSNIGIPPEDTFEMLNEKNIVVHTIGIGTPEGGLATELGVPFSLDEQAIRNIAEATGGNFYNPLSTEELEKAFNEIVLIQDRPVKKDISIILLIIALGTLFVEWSLIATRYRVL